MSPQFLFLSGSIRKESLNAALARQAASMARDLDIDAEHIDLNDYPMPLYNGDLETESSLPNAAVELKAKFVAADGFFIAAPEYNSSITPLLKNTLDWVSRRHLPEEKPLAAYGGKVAGLASASPGGFGGMRGLIVLRMMLSNIGVMVVPQQTAIAAAHTKRNDDGAYTDALALNGIRATLKAMQRLSTGLASIDQ